MPHSTAVSAASAGAVDFPAEALRREFPALERAGDFIFFDNAAGAQVPQMVLDAVTRHLIDHNVQRGGRYSQSIAVDTTIAQARESLAMFLNARRSDEIALGMNATSFIRIISLAIGQSLEARNEIIVTSLDHEANIATWLALEPFGARFKMWEVREDGRLHLEDLEPLLSPRTRLVACTLASNALGTITDVRGVADRAHAVGAEVFLDAVHYGPHGTFDVQAYDCDYLACSGYKIFAPHMGFMWGRYELLEKLPTFREDFIPNAPPFKIEAGTFVYENVAGMDAAVQYLTGIGSKLGGKDSAHSTPRQNLTRGMDAIRSYEQVLSVELLRVLGECGARIYGVDDPAQVAHRVPTFCLNLPGIAPARVTEVAAQAGIGIRDGHMYAPRLMKRLGLDPDTGAVRVSLVHYNTLAEIHRLGEVLRGLRR